MFILLNAATVTMEKLKLMASPWAWVLVLDGALHALLQPHDVNGMSLSLRSWICVLYYTRTHDLDSVIQFIFALFTPYYDYLIRA